jgi:hypothetical protein
MKNRPARSFVPLGALALALCSGVSAVELCPGADGSRTETTTIETRLAAVPALLRIPPKVTRPPILLWHGFGPPASERQLMDAMPLDDVPAIKVYLGLPQFGARERPDGREAHLCRPTSARPGSSTSGPTTRASWHDGPMPFSVRETSHATALPC